MLAHELYVDADGAGDERHDVLRDGTDFVHAKNGRVGHGFVGAEHKDEKLLVCHALHCERLRQE